MAASLLTTGAAFAQAEAPLPLVPWPAQMSRTAETVRIGQGAVIAVPAGDVGARRVAWMLAERVERERGLKLVVREGADGAIVLRRIAGQPEGAYTLDTAGKGATIAASDDAGLFYGSVSLWQLLTPDAARGAVALPGLHIADAPRFRWRGLMLDVTRHFAPIAEVRALVDQMALHKLNVLHLHLSDDQGWRIEIKRYPDLTRIGGFRTPPDQLLDGTAHPRREGGFYTQDELRALVAYAAERHITVVPEIDMPGHAQAVVAAYPKVGVDILEPGQSGPGNPRPAVSGDWGVNPYLFEPDEPTIAFVQQVLDEVMDVFPSPFIHVGGDEAVKDQWKASAKVQQQMKTLGITSEDALQSWFIERIGKHLEAHGRSLIGWDEILEGGLPAGASVMSWRGTEGAVAAAKLGHDVVLAPAGALYLDYLQTTRSDEPEGRIGPLPIEKVYRFEPVTPQISAEQAQHVLGLEGALWTEYQPSRRHREHALFPRLAALSEVAWSPAAARDWQAFVPRLVQQQQRYARQGVGAADTAFAVDVTIDGGPAAALAAGRASVTLSTQVTHGTIHYTTDGSAPSLHSPRYTQPLSLPLPTVLKTAAFAPDGSALSASRTQRLDVATLLTRDSNHLNACPNGEMGLRVPLRPDSTAWSPVFNVNLMDSCWIYPQARLDGVQAIHIDAARVPRNYGLAHDAVKVVQHPAKTPAGELEVREGSCDGALLATLPLPAGKEVRLLPLRAALPAREGVHDLCLRFTAPITGPLYAIDAVRLQAPSKPPTPPR